MNKDNSGALFANDRKEKDSQPDAKGECIIDGVHYWISSWNNTSAKGTPYKGLKFEKKDDKFKEAKDAASVPEDVSDEIPFMRAF